MDNYINYCHYCELSKQPRRSRYYYRGSQGTKKNIKDACSTSINNSAIKPYLYLHIVIVRSSFLTERNKLYQLVLQDPFDWTDKTTTNLTKEKANDLEISA